jgi:hypothetical protein
MMASKLHATTTIKVIKYKSEEDYKKGKPYAVVEKKGNVLLTSGMTAIWNLVTGNSSSHYDNTNSYIGVGDSDTAANENQTDLLGSNKTYKQCYTGFPAVGGKALLCFAIFGASDANYTWNEFVVKNNATGICLNRAVQSFGTKTSGEVWPIQIQIQLSN